MRDPRILILLFKFKAILYTFLISDRTLVYNSSILSDF
ncbi:hypothetical protein H376_8250 [Rickettsia prowazekii str. GvF12]|nr:hypothetical protein H374_5570 [Rickettsia prowazekii str. NMRC Madrid E]EOB09880.1 hypothetical protein H376_8250 [Rickettsia prowazekii str. GvF12]EOB10960.1 hypothetical protein H377_2610 [Rickettsia prowazekii str. Cairo 3]